MLQPSTVYINGQYISNDKASVSPEDRGFYFADGVYEMIKFYKGRPFCFEEHMDRLSKSLNAVRINFSGHEKIRDICDALILTNQLENKYAGVYIQITRGVAIRTHRFPTGVQPSIYARAFPLPSFINEMKNGVMVLTREDIRWLRCNIKSIALLANTLLFEEVAEQGAFECVLIRNGIITEATHSNILAVKQGEIFTHPDSNLILPGITKAAVLRLCENLHIPVSGEPVKASEMSTYDEWFLTGTGSEIVPVIEIDGKPVGKGKPGPVTRLLQEEFFKITYGELAGEKLVIGEYNH